MPATRVFFLSADTSLSKSFWLDSNNELQKSSYPNVKDFTSHTESCNSIRDFHAALIKHAALGHCLIKGQLHKDLNSESRAGSTKSDDATTWLCLDLDGAPYKSPTACLAEIPELKDVAHIVQYSASSGLNGNTKLSCHIFMMIDNKVPAASLKTWAMDKNLNIAGLRAGIMLSRTAATLHWPLDITACQNDKILYIAPPKVGKGIRCTLKDSERIQLIPGKIPYVAAKDLLPKFTLEALKLQATTLRNNLRVSAKLPPLRAQTKWIGEHEIQTKPGEAQITGQKEERNFVYFNLNGGDSWSYYHPVGNPDFIRCFKDNISYSTKELLPDYYRDVRASQKVAQSQPTEGGELVLAFRDKRTAAYWNGTWAADKKLLELHPAKSELQLNHWMQNHNLPPFDVIPIWDLHFNPQSSVIVDEERRTINTYVPSHYFDLDFTKLVSLDKSPLIKRIIMHAVGGGEENETTEHFLNWLAVIVQYKIKTKTAWLLYGTEGTGKGLIVNKIMAPLLGRQYVQSKRASDLEDKFNGWLEQALIGFIDEIQVSSSTKKNAISGDLRNFITEDHISMRHMNRASIMVENFSNLIFSSNENDPIVIKSNDRRYNVGYFQFKPLVITKHEIDVVLPQELESFMQYLMTRKADAQLAGTAIKNEAHQNVVNNNKNSIDITAAQLADGDIMALWDARMDMEYAAHLNPGNTGIASLFHSIIKREIQLLVDEPNGGSYKTKVLKGSPSLVTRYSKLNRDELTVIFEFCVGNMPRTANKITSLLRHHNLITKRMRIGDQITYGLDVEWRAPSDWLQERDKEFKKQIAGMKNKPQNVVPLRRTK